MLAKLILRADQLGYGLTFDATYCDNKYQHGHRRDGNHPKRLAADMNVFLDNEYLTGTPAYFAHRLLHEYWSSLGGADMIAGDYNHYSLEHEGMV